MVFFCCIYQKLFFFLSCKPTVYLFPLRKAGSSYCDVWLFDSQHRQFLKSPLGRRSWPLELTTDWWNKRPAQGAQITLHPCLSYLKGLWRAREDADDPASRAALNSVLETPFKPPNTFPTALQILEVLHKFSLQWTTFLPASEEHGPLALETLLAAFIRTLFPLNSAPTVESPSSWGQTLTLRGKVVTCNSAVGCQWQCVSLMHRQGDKHPACVWSPLADLSLKTFYMSWPWWLRKVGNCHIGFLKVKACHTLNTRGGTQVADVWQHPVKKPAVFFYSFRFFFFFFCYDAWYSCSVLFPWRLRGWL